MNDFHKQQDVSLSSLSTSKLIKTAAPPHSTDETKGQCQVLLGNVGHQCADKKPEATGVFRWGFMGQHTTWIPHKASKAPQGHT